MTDTTTIWDPANARGDWVLQLPSVEQQLVLVPAPQQFGMGDGETVNFALTPPGQIIGGLIAQIYRNDWQGNQPLYPTPRTNYAFWSGSLTGAGDTHSSATALAASTTVLAPDGVSPAVYLTDADDGSAAVDHWAQSPGSNGGLANVSPQQVNTVSIYAKAADRNYLVLRLRGGNGASNTNGSIYAGFDLSAGTVVAASGGVTTAIIPMGNGWYRCVLTGIASRSASDVYTSSWIWSPLTLAWSNLTSYSYAGVTGQGVYVWGWQIEAGAVATSYIPTAGAAVTVTDYTLAPNGLVTMSSPPVLLAALTWQGQYAVSDFTPGGFLQTGNDLQTAYLISLFTDRIAQPGDVIPDGTTDTRGWIGDAGAAYPIGSRLWLLERATKSQQTMNRARTYVTEAVQWLIDDSVVSKHDITLAWVQGAPGTWGIGIWIQAWRPDGTKYPQFNWVWGKFQ